MSYRLPSLSLEDEARLETRAVLRKAALAHRYLAELKGVSATIPYGRKIRLDFCNPRIFYNIFLNA